jgi:hypothetical protein
MINHRTKLLLGGLAALAAATTSAPASATTFVLDFSGNICASAGGKCDSGAAISNTYGDHQGVDVSYRSVDPSGDTYNANLNYWGSGFGDLQGVVWGGNSSTTSEITLTAAPGYEIALLSFDFGTYLSRYASSPVEITSLGGTSILSGLLATNPGAHNHVDVASAFFADGIRLRWGPNGYDVGMDNIAFEVRAIPGAAVPEVSTWAMMIAGFGLTGAALRNRRRKVSRPVASGLVELAR